MKKANKFKLDIKNFVERVECQKVGKIYDPTERADRYAFKLVAVMSKDIPMQVPEVVQDRIKKLIGSMLGAAGFAEVVSTFGPLEVIAHDLEGEYGLLNMDDHATEPPQAITKHVTCQHEDCKAATKVGAINAAKEREIKDCVIPADAVAKIIGTLAFPDQGKR